MRNKAKSKSINTLQLRQIAEVLEDIGDCIFAFDRNWRFTYVNRRGAALLSCKPDELIGQNFWEKCPQILGKELELKFRRAMEDDQPQQFDDCGIFYGRWYNIHVDSSSEGIVVCGQDITEYKKTEANLQNDLSALTRIHTLSSKLLETEGQQSLLQDIMDAAVAIMKAQSGTLQLLEGNVLRVAASYGLPQPFLDFFNKLENVQTVFVEATYSGDRVIIPDIETSPLVMGHPSYAVLHEAKVRTVQSTPMVSRSGKLLGVLATHWEVPFTPAEEDLWRLDLLVRQATDLIEQSQARGDLIKAKEELEIKVKERTQELTESEEKYRSLVENSSEAIVVGQGDKFKFVNQKMVELLGYSREELLSMKHIDTIHPDYRKLISEFDALLAKGKKVFFRHDMRLICKNGDIKWVDSNTIQITWEGHPAILGLMTDITERKQMEQALKDYAQKITRVQEEERKKIAFELHDDTAQYLAILKLQLDSIIQSGEIQSPKLLEKLGYLEKDAGRAVDDIRRYSHELRPGVLDHLGLQAALEQVAEDHNKLGYMRVEVNVEGDEPELSEDIKLGLFRIAQEAINNCRKHAKADKAVINLKFSEHSLKMIVSDNGIGFDLKKSASNSKEKGSLGLMSMQERAKMIGANLKIESRLGKGTQVIIKAKL